MADTIRKRPKFENTECFNFERFSFVDCHAHINSESYDEKDIKTLIDRLAIKSFKSNVL